MHSSVSRSRQSPEEPAQVGADPDGDPEGDRGGRREKSAGPRTGTRGTANTTA